MLHYTTTRRSILRFLRPPLQACGGAVAPPPSTGISSATIGPRWISRCKGRGPSDGVKVESLRGSPTDSLRDSSVSPPAGTAKPPALTPLRGLPGFCTRNLHRTAQEAGRKNSKNSSLEIPKSLTAMSRLEALSLADKYGLRIEVEYAIDVLGMDPEDALSEWDI